VTRVGILDSGIGYAPGLRIVGRALFRADDDRAATDGDAAPDALGHGTQIASIIARAAPETVFLDAHIFLHGLRAGAAQAAAGLDWLSAEGARLVNMSFGLHEDQAALREACARALARGVVLVASSPARGALVYPARYAGVIRATGDARCAPGEISWLGSAQADYGAHVRAPDGRTAGASIGCAHLSALIAAMLNDHPAWSVAEVHAELQRKAAFRGPERRRR
jgi:subtilisin family serine protease